MSKKMLIDATHEEETRVAVVDGGRLEEFDYESLVRKQIKGGIYLAKVTRVEPSLQAAFVNYGGNRHGFLPFSEIHPDYFRIPVSDREALLEEQKAEFDRNNNLDDDDIIDEGHEDEIVEADSDEEDDEAVVEVGGADKPADEDDADLVEKEKKKAKKKSAKKSKKKSAKDESDEAEEEDEVAASDDVAENEEVSEEENSDDADEDKKSEQNKKGRGRGRNNKRRRGRANMRRKNDELVDDEGAKPFRFSLKNKYKIQEVIKRGQIMLIQVSKEERGNKGAAVTSYLSLPGRYCVLMPNSPRGGGVSRKIGNFKDRKRMREILKELTIPDGMSVILRTAGVSRTKAEIKRDLDYLMRLWNTIREETLQSSAPALINEEGNLIKRSIRDLYTRDIDEVLVAGEKGYKTAKDFMKMLVPSHAKKVKEYNEEKVPLFHRYKVEQQISEIGEISVTLKSGGYLIINPTEALVSIDVNSGKATKERHIEETALKTNLEAASEVARQLRLRDLGGLVVIDFIDMEERRNNRKVENRLRDALSNDRARIQVGRISSFGLLELSRQRLNPSLTEAQFEKCPHCDGSGTVKTMDFAAISALRSLIEEGIKGKVAELSLNLPNKVAVYILNNKRQMLADIEDLYDFRVHIKTDDKLKASEFRIDVIKKKDSSVQDDDEEEDNSASAKKSNNDDQQDKPKKSRRRGRRGGRRHNKNKQKDDEKADDKNQEQDDSDDKSEEENKKPAKKSSKKAAKKAVKKSSKKPASNKNPEPSNDDDAKAGLKRDNKASEANSAKEYEVVNEAPAKKKKGWWNRIMD